MARDRGKQRESQSDSRAAEPEKRPGKQSEGQAAEPKKRQGKQTAGSKGRRGKRSGAQNGQPEPLTPEQVIREKRRSLANREVVKSFFLRLVLMAAVLWIIFGMVFGLAPMKNDDMSPSISAGDLLLFYRLEDRLHIGDVVMLEKEGRQYTGRIVAQGGDMVEITDSAELKVNNSIVAESDIYFSTPRYDSDVEYPLTLADDEYFILCDYREGAKDSRYYGAVHKSELLGKVITVVRRSGI